MSNASRRWSSWTAVAAGLMAASTAWAQALPTQDGRALDANTYYGSPFNSVRSSNRIDGNMYITGQVGGGFYYFHGTAAYAGSDQLRLSLGGNVPDNFPYAGPAQLRMNMGGNVLDNFLRESVGISQVRTGQVYGPTNYYSLDRTILGTVGIAGGYNAPGSSMPRNSYIPSAQTRMLYNSAMEPYQPLMGEVGRQLQVDAMIQPSGGVAQPGAAAPVDLTAAAAAAVAAGRGAERLNSSEVYGVLRQQDRERLAAELSLGERSVAARARVTGKVKGQPAEGQPRAGRAGGPEETPAGQEPPEARTDQGIPAGAEIPPPGQDVFIDLLSNLRQARQTKVKPGTGEQPDRGTGGIPASQPNAAGKPGVGGRPAVELIGGAVVLHTLAGNSRDMFNARMARAESLMKDGKFYEAAGQYELAAVLNPTNPLAQIGAGLALFAADEHLSAGLQIRQGMVRFPPIMETQVDVGAMLGQEVLNKRIHQLEARLAKQGPASERSLLLLAAFVRRAMGQPDKAAVYARLLYNAAGDDKICRAYANFLLTGKLPRPTTLITEPPKPELGGPPAAK